MEWFPKVLTLISESKRLYASIFISSLIYLFVPGFLFETEGFGDVYSKTRPYSIASLVLSSGFLIFDIFRFSFNWIKSIIEKIIKNIKYKKMMNSLDRNQVLFVREFFIQDKSSIYIKSSDRKLFVDGLKDNGVVSVASSSVQMPGHPFLLRYKLDCHAKNFIQNNMDIIFEGLPSDSEEIAKQRPQYLVEGQRLGQIR